MNTFFDIETVPGQPEESHKALIANTIEAPTAMKKSDTIRAWHDGEGKYAGARDKAIEDEYRKQSFDAAYGGIITMAFATEDAEVVSFQRELDGCEITMINDFFHDLVNSLDGRPPMFVGHFVAGFDMRFLFRRCVILGVRPPFSIKFDGRHGTDYFDNMIAWCGYKEKISQDNLSKALGLKGKPSDIDGSKVWDFAKEGRIDEIAAYNRDDVEQCRAIYKRIKFL